MALRFTSTRNLQGHSYRALMVFNRAIWGKIEAVGGLGREYLNPEYPTFFMDE